MASSDDLRDPPEPGEPEAGCIYVDADACPVRQEIMDVAARHAVPVILVCDGGIRPPRQDGVQLVVVPAGADAADDWIASRAGPGDIVITADIELARRCLDRSARVLSHDGSLFTAANIGMKISMRDLCRHLRETGMPAGGGRPFSRQDRSAFLQQLDLLLRQTSPR